MEDVEAAEALLAGRHGGVAVVLHADVALDHRGDAASGLDLAGGVFGGGTLAVHERDARALACEQQRGRPAVADLLPGRLAGAGDDRNPAGQTAAPRGHLAVRLDRHQLSRWAVIDRPTGASGSRPVVAIRRAIAM